MGWIPKQTIVVPVDFSDESLTAVEAAIQLVESRTGIHVVHVLPELSPLEPGELWETVDNQSREDHAKRALSDLLSADAYHDVHLDIRFGDPGHEIAQLAEDLNAQLIVLPSHGRTGISRLLIGSVAERVVRLAHCNVLVLRK